MLRLKALFRARAIRTPSKAVYRAADRGAWLQQLPEAGVRFRAEMSYAQLEVLQQLRPKAKAALLAEASPDPAWDLLRGIPYVGPVRVALLLATLRRPWRFRTKRHLWAFAGFAVATRTSSEYEMVNGRPARRRARPAIFEFIETWYNRDRRHSTLGYRSPATYEREVLRAAA